MRTIYFAQVERFTVGVSRVGPRGASVCLGGPYADGPIKIGITTRLQSRMLNLSSRAGQPVRLLGAFDGDFADERQMHHMFAHLRIGDRFATSTEWFRPAWELTNFITSLAAYDVSEWRSLRPRGYWSARGGAGRYVYDPRTLRRSSG